MLMRQPSANAHQLWTLVNFGQPSYFVHIVCIDFTESTSTVWEIPRSRYTRVMRRRRMSAVVFACRFEDFEVGKSWSYIWLNAGLTTKVRIRLNGSSCWDIYLTFHCLKMKIHCVVSEIWPWEFSLLHLKREVCLHIPEYAALVWSGVVL